MTTRDRTSEFMQYRSIKPKSTDQDNALQDTLQLNVIPEWVHRMKDVRDTELKIQENLTTLENLRKQHLKVEFSSTRDEAKEEAEIDLCQDVIDRYFKNTERLIHELEKVYLNSLPEGGTDYELSILRNIKMCLINEINQISKNYRESQRRYMIDVKKQRAVFQKWSGGERQHMLEQELENDALMDQYLQKGMTQEQVETIMLNQQLAEDRVREFERIFTSIKSLHEMFQDMNTLVIEQGAVLDRIDYNMNITHTRVQKARVELEKAADYQKAGGFKLCVLFMVIMIIGMIVALIFKAII